MFLSRGAFQFHEVCVQGYFMAGDIYTRADIPLDMHDYLMQVSYSPEGLVGLLKKPQDRIKAVAPAVERLGGKVLGGGFCLGDYDVAVIVSLPNNEAVAALSMAFGSGGTVRAVKTTPLLSGSEAVRAMKKASQAGYKPAK